MEKLLLGGVAGLAVLGGVYFAGYQARAKHDAPIIANWHAAADDYARGMKRYQEVFHEAERLRTAEGGKARDALSGEQQACADRMAAVRASAAALKGLMSRPVKVEKGCPVPALWTAKELTPVLRPEVR